MKTSQWYKWLTVKRNVRLEINCSFSRRTMVLLVDARFTKVRDCTGCVGTGDLTLQITVCTNRNLRYATGIKIHIQYQNFHLSSKRFQRGRRLRFKTSGCITCGTFGLFRQVSVSAAAAPISRRLVWPGVPVMVSLTRFCAFAWFCKRIVVLINGEKIKRRD